MSDSAARAGRFVQWLLDNFDRLQRERILKQHCMQGRHERKARMTAIVELSAELERIRAVSIYSTALGLAAIESIVEGDWKGAEIWVDHFRFEDEPEIGRLWAKFQRTLETACLSARARAASGAGARPS